MFNRAILVKQQPEHTSDMGYSLSDDAGGSIPMPEKPNRRQNQVPSQNTTHERPDPATHAGMGIVARSATIPIDVKAAEEVEVVEGWCERPGAERRKENVAFGPVGVMRALMMASGENWCPCLRPERTPAETPKKNTIKRIMEEPKQAGYSVGRCACVLPRRDESLFHYS